MSPETRQFLRVLFLAVSALLVEGSGPVEAGGSFPDCNNNGVDDAQDIGDGTSDDCNADGVPDECGVPLTCDATETQKLTASDAPALDFGVSVCVSGDTAVVGARQSECGAGLCGSAYVFRFDGTSWIQEQKLTASDAEHGDLFGNSVAVSGDTTVVAAPGDDCAAGSNCGAIYVFRFDGTSWVQEQKMVAADAAASVGFGSSNRSVSVSGDTAVVGAYVDDCAAGSGCGSAYIFHFDGTSWVQEQKLTASDAAADDGFGVSVSVNADTAVVGAWDDDCAAGSGCGSAYVFRSDGTNWTEEDKLTASDAAAGDRFGVSVSINADTAVVGARDDDCAAGEDCGSAYLFRFDGTNWIEEDKVTAPDAAAGDGFGASVSVSSDTAVIGAWEDDCAAGEDCGSAYLFRFDGTNWIEEWKPTASDAAAGDRFGVSVSASGNRAVAGAYLDDCSPECAPFCSCGSAYVFDLTGPDDDCNGVADACDFIVPNPLDPDPSGIDKSRTVTFQPPGSAVAGTSETAIRLIPTAMYDESVCPPRGGGLPDLSAFENEIRWLGPPARYSEDTLPPMPDFIAAQVQCTPHFRDWSQSALAADFPDADVSVVHAFGAVVVPCSRYVLQAVDQSCPNLTDEECYSPPTELGTGLWGDLWQSYGLVNFVDINEEVLKYKGIAYEAGPPESGAPPKARAMLHGNIPPLDQLVSFVDISLCVDAYKAIAYKEPGPTACP